MPGTVEDARCNRTSCVQNLCLKRGPTRTRPSLADLPSQLPGRRCGRKQGEIFEKEEETDDEKGRASAKKFCHVRKGNSLISRESGLETP